MCLILNLWLKCLKMRHKMWEWPLIYHIIYNNCVSLQTCDSSASKWGTGRVKLTFMKFVCKSFDFPLDFHWFHFREGKVEIYDIHKDIHEGVVHASSINRLFSEDWLIQHQSLLLFLLHYNDVIMPINMNNLQIFSPFQSRRWRVCKSFTFLPFDKNEL